VNEAEVFVLADHALNRIIAQIRDDQWLMPIPPDFHRRPTPHTPTLREIINYLAYDDAWVPDILAGRTMDEVGRDKFDGDLLGEDPKASFATLVEKACAAAQALEPADLGRTVHLSFGDFTTADYFQQINGFRMLRSVDIGRVIDIKPNLPDALVQGVWDEISPRAEQLRKIGVFPQEVPVAPEAPLLQRLLGITGRQPTATNLRG